VQLGFTVALVTGLVFGFTVATQVQRERETLTRELTLRLLAKGRSLSLGAAGSLLRRDPELGLHPLIRSALAETPDLIDLVVLDATGRIQGQDLLASARRRRRRRRSARSLRAVSKASRRGLRRPPSSSPIITWSKPPAHRSARLATRSRPRCGGRRRLSRAPGDAGHDPGGGERRA
jgi:hypothetical protein